MTASDISDDELEDLLFDAGMTVHEINACRIAYPEIKLVLWAIMQIAANRIAKRLVDELFV